MKHTGVQHFIDAIIHGPPEPPRQLPEVSGPVLLHEGRVPIPHVLIISDDSEEVAEGDFSVYAADFYTTRGADAVEASVFIAVV